MCWRKSPHSGGDQNCVEIADVPGGTVVRHSKHPEGPCLMFTEREWVAFVDGIRDGTLR